MPRASKGKGGGDNSKSEAKNEANNGKNESKSEIKLDNKADKADSGGASAKGNDLKVEKEKSSASSSGQCLSPTQSTGSSADENKGAIGGVPPSSREKIQTLLGDLFVNIKDIQVERDRAEHNLTNIHKTHEKMREEGKVTPYYRQKLKSLYSAATTDAEAEAEVIRSALEKIKEIKKLQEKSAKQKHDSGRPKQIMRRGVLMSQLQQNATTLPLWVSKPGESPPPLCGAVPADGNYISQPEDKVAARVKGQDGEENWILAEVVHFNAHTGKYEVDDVDAEEGKERHSISRRRVVPLPIWKANPETDPGALFAKKTLVLALYPQTTCFYRALVDEPPKKPQDDYSVLFEDTSYATGYSPPLMVPQRYVIACKEDKKK
ncbi:SAGA-associated factor 29-like [Physella acuta]|uniref:SAGA-associated factor 29-like n=1 Tax=Physella acuta TaxID=109671 RepID=UPI0027DBC5D7|nr:SAGA-associated factor 29-like [Physella acuta]XP_059174149.1 SAGA-associated factor 29-like [Physella acuta]